VGNVVVTSSVLDLKEGEVVLSWSCPVVVSVGNVVVTSSVLVVPG
jgi:hypothetical protein